jgi:hypothetical protein
MSTYELDDALVQRALNQSRVTGELADVLQGQLPIPVPTKPGAVIQLEDGSVAVLATADETDPSRWLMSDKESSKGWYSGRELPRIIRVLSEGVDL